MQTKAQSAMEYLMTYGWAILVIAVIITVLFALGLFNGVSAPTSCVAQLGYTCANPSYTSNVVSFTFGQSTGRYYYAVNVFVASESLGLDSSNKPANISSYSYAIGSLAPGQTVTVDFNSLAQGGIQPDAPVGTPLAAYVWLGYCTNSQCAGGVQYSKVAAINAQASGSSAFGGGSSTSSTSTSSTSTSTIHYVQITLTTTSGSTATPSKFQQMLTIGSSTCGGGNCFTYANSGLSNVEFTTGAADTGTALEAWCASGCSTSSLPSTWWVNLGSNTISGNGGTLNIYMNLMPSNVMSPGGPTGEAPQLYGGSYAQSSYAQFDDGHNVFAFYQAFGGLSGGNLPSGWYAGQSSTAGITDNPNSITVTNTGAAGIGGISTSSTAPLPVPMATDWYEAVNSNPNDFTSQGVFALGSCITFGSNFGSGQVNLNVMNNGAPSVSDPTYMSPTLYTLWANQTGQALMLNNAVAETTNNASTGLNPNFNECGGENYLTMQLNTPNSFSAKLYFWDERLMPLQGGMPSASFGSVQ